MQKKKPHRQTSIDIRNRIIVEIEEIDTPNTFFDIERA